MILFRRPNNVLRRIKQQLKTAIPDLVAILTTEIEYLEALEDKADTEPLDNGIARNAARYPNRRLIKVLKASANAHLKLKLDKPNASQVALIKYLNPSDLSQQGFAASCLRTSKERSDDLSELSIFELKGLYVYLLSRLD